MSVFLTEVDRIPLRGSYFLGYYFLTYYFFAGGGDSLLAASFLGFTAELLSADVLPPFGGTLFGGITGTG